MADFLRDVLAERQKADTTWPPIHSHHEGYAVLLEEVDEYWEIVRQKAYLRNTQAMYLELVQVAAVAWRIVRDLRLAEHDDAALLALLRALPTSLLVEVLGERGILCTTGGEAPDVATGLDALVAEQDAPNQP